MQFCDVAVGSKKCKRYQEDLPALSIVIVNWNAGRHLRECVDSIELAQRAGFVLREVVIVDNASTDNSLNGIEARNVSIKVLRNKHNMGFAFACNQGVRVATGNYVLMLNPDTRLFEDSLTVPLMIMNNPINSQVGICGIQLVDGFGQESISYAKFPSLTSFLLRALGLDKLVAKVVDMEGRVNQVSDGVLQVDQVIGAFFIVRRALFDQLNGFDLRFFVYFEEVDFSLRARKCGWQSVLTKRAKCFHVGGGTSRQVKAARLFYSLDSRVLYGFKHFSLITALGLLLVTIFLEFPSRMVFEVGRGKWRDARDTLEGYNRFLLNLPRSIRVSFLEEASRGHHRQE